MGLGTARCKSQVSSRLVGDEARCRCTVLLATDFVLASCCTCIIVPELSAMCKLPNCKMLTRHGIKHYTMPSQHFGVYTTVWSLCSRAVPLNLYGIILQYVNHRRRGCMLADRCPFLPTQGGNKASQLVG